MQIGIDIRSLDEPQPTGVATYTGELLRQLFDIGQENEFKLFYNSYKGEIQFKFPEYIGSHLGPVKVFEFTKPSKVLNFNFRFFGRPKIDQMLAGINLMFLPNPTFYALSADLPLVVTFHDLSYIHYQEFFSFKRRFWHRLVNARRIARRANKIIADSQATKYDLVNIFGISEEKIRVIHLGVNQEVYTPEIPVKDLERVKAKYQLPNKYILSLGALEPRKNILGIVEAFERLENDDYFLLVAGPKAWLYEPLLKRIQSSPKTDQIGLIDFVPQKDKAALYRLAEIFLYPSFYEGFGLPLLEAMACGTPVITSVSSSVGEVVGSAGLLIDPYDLNQISEALKQLINDHQLHQKLSTKGLEQVKKFTWRETARKTLQVFQEVCG